MLRRGLLAAGTFTALLAICSAGVVGYTYAKYDGQIKRQNVLLTRDHNIAEPTAQLHAANYLIIGSDSRAGAGAGYGHVDGARSDTTILVHISKNHQDVSVVS
ncbi:MAG: LytR family transcriptional regulator, partial [Actinomycetota bacterium]|nr:LytR family transcriptional regulator [Actinomycetota bacterium]